MNSSESTDWEEYESWTYLQGELYGNWNGSENS